MANEKRLIDANEAIEKINCLCVDGNENWIGTDNQSFVDHADVIDIISDMPTVDAVEVVRCPMCRQVNKFGEDIYYCDLTGMPVDVDDYCSLGERKDNGTSKIR